MLSYKFSLYPMEQEERLVDFLGLDMIYNLSNLYLKYDLIFVGRLKLQNMNKRTRFGGE